VICFAIMMISINGYMSVVNSVAQAEIDNIAHFGLESGLNAVGQMIAMGIIVIIINNFSPSNSVDDVALAIFGVGFVLMLIFMILILNYGQYWPCSETSNDTTTVVLPFSIYQSIRCFYNQMKIYVNQETSAWYTLFAVMFCWTALFAFVPWSVDWYASTYYSSEVDSPEYSRGVVIALWARFCQQLVMADYGFFILLVTENNSQSKQRLGIIWPFILISLAVYSGCLFVAAFTGSKDLAYAAFVMSGIGMAAIYSRKINIEAMIGQMIILSVGYFGFHLNYRWVFVIGGASCIIAIPIGVILTVDRSDHVASGGGGK
jgi:hypothetical protein